MPRAERPLVMKSSFCSSTKSVVIRVVVRVMVPPKETAWAEFEEIRNLDFLRKKKTEQKYLDFTMASSERYDSADHIRELEQRERKIKQVLDSLPSPTKRIFTLCFVERKKYTEAAEMLEISVSTVKKHIVRALKLIREQRES